jgi:hypothetical protein
MPRLLRVTIHFGVLMLGIGMLALSASPVGAAASDIRVVAAAATPTPTPTPASAQEICAAAEDLAALGKYTEALALIDKVRADALAAIAEGDSLDTSRVNACDEERKAIEGEAPDPTPTPTASATPAPVPDAELIGSTWNDFIAEWVTPLVPLSAFVLGAAFVAFVLARFGATLWKPSTRSTKAGRRWTAWTGALAILAGPLLFAALVVPAADRRAAQSPVVCPTPTSSGGSASPSPAPCEALGEQAREAADWSQVWSVNGSTIGAALLLFVVSGLGVVLLSFVFATRQRASIVIKRGATDADTLVPELVEIMGDMTGGVALGVEVPVGPDIEGLQDSIVEQTGAKPFVAWIQTFWNLISSITPWKLDVVIETGDAKDKAAAYTLSRNGKVVVQGRVDADSPGLMLDQATGATETQRIASVLAATVVVEMSRAYRSEWDLAMHGAVEARSVALQYLASKWHSGDDRRETALRILAQALHFDPGTRAALVTLWNFTYRNSVEPAEMEEYNRWLISQIAEESRIALEGGKKTIRRLARDQLLIRLLLTQGAMARNLTAVGVPPRFQDLFRADLLLALIEASRGGEGEGDRRRKRFLAEINHERLVEDGPEHQGAVGEKWVTPDEMGFTDDLGVERAPRTTMDGVSVIPSTLIAYSLLCHIVRDVAKAEPPHPPPSTPSAARVREKNRAEILFTTGPQGVQLRRLLAVSMADADLRFWAQKDPELTFARMSATFLKLIGGGDPPILREDAKKLFDAAMKSGLLEGNAVAASNFLASRGYTEVDGLKAIQGSLAWTRLSRDLHAHLAQSYAFAGDLRAVDDWMNGLVTPPEDEKKAPPKEDEKPKEEPPKGATTIVP